MSERRVIVIGAGMGGLAAACDLARQGVAVTLLERAEATGGKIHQREVGPARIDSGPTVFTMRWVFDDLLGACGETLEDGTLELLRLPIIARHAWSAEAQLDLHADRDASIEAVAGFAGASEASRFAAFCDEAERLYHALEHAYIRSERPSLVSMSTDLGVRGLALLGGLGPFASLWQSLGRHFHDPRLRQLFARYATYCGGSPWQAPATLALIAHVEMRGVWAARGGMQSIAARLERCARRLGVTVRLNREVAAIETAAGRAVGARLADGETLAADAVIFNGDAQALAAGLLGEGARRAVSREGLAPRSLSALTLGILGKASGFDLSYHNVFFQTDYASEFRDVFEQARLPQHPTLYLCAQDRLPGAAHLNNADERLFCLINAPARGDTAPLAQEEIQPCVQQAFTHLQRCGLTIDAPAIQTVVTAPQHFHDRFPGSGGALYGMAPHGWMSSFRRPSASTPVPGLFLAGGSAHPGAGVPMATLSGRLAAATLMAHLDSTRRSHRVRISGGMSTA